MKTVIAMFETGRAARDAVKRLHEAGFAHEDILFLLHTGREDPAEAEARRAEDAGRKAGDLLADAAASAASFMPFVGARLAATPLAAAVRDVLGTTGALAGRLAGAMTEGGFTSSQQSGLTGARGGAAVALRAEAARTVEAAAILAGAGAVRVETGAEAPA